MSVVCERVRAYVKDRPPVYSQALKAVGKIFRSVFLEHLYLNTTRKTKPQRDFVLECGDPDPPRSEWKVIAFQALAAATRAVPGPWANGTPPSAKVHELMLERAKEDPFLLLVIISSGSWTRSP